MGGESSCSTDKLIWGREGAGLLICSAAETWSDEAWAQFLDGSLEMEARYGQAKVVFCYFPRGNPSAAQRRMSAEATQKSQLAARVALLSDSAITRGAFTAIQWALGRKTAHRAFRPTEIHPSLEWLTEAAAFDPAAAEQRARELVTAANAALATPRS